MQDCDNCLESSCIDACSTFSIAIFRHSSLISFSGYNEVSRTHFPLQKTESETTYNFSGTLEMQKLITGHACVSAGNNSRSPGQIFMNFYAINVNQYLSSYQNICQNFTMIRDTSYET